MCQKTLFRIVLTAIFILGAIFFSTAQAAPPAQDPRPPRDGGGAPPGGGGVVGGEGVGDGAEDRCASLMGQVINWGFGGEGGVTTELKTGSWQVSTVSATDGNYGFGGLGVGVAVLHVALTPGQTEQFQPHLQDAGVYLNCEFPIVANIALFKGARITPPATIEMSALHDVIPPGGGTEITLEIKNSLPNDITHVVVTDLMPLGLIALDVSTSVGPKDTKVINSPDGQLVVVNLDKMAAGAEATVRITVIAAADLPRAQVTNTATLFYQEGVADQAAYDFIVGSGRAPTLATPIIPATPRPPEAGATPLATPELEPTIVATTTTTPSPTVSPTPTVESEDGEAFVPPDGLPKTGDDFVPPDLLPVTGEDALQIPNTLPDTGLGVILPFSGFGLAVLAFLVHYLRSGYRDRE
jgi:uncharacterized repeat protein (TIGR01451 family)